MSKSHEIYLKEMVCACPNLYGGLIEDTPVNRTSMICGVRINKRWFGVVRDLPLRLEELLRIIPEAFFYKICGKVESTRNNLGWVSTLCNRYYKHRVDSLKGGHE